MRVLMATTRGFGDPEFDRLVEAAGSESDPVRRRELYVKAEARAVAEAPWVFLFHPRDEVLIAPGWAELELLHPGRLGHTPRTRARLGGSSKRRL